MELATDKGTLLPQSMLDNHKSDFQRSGDTDMGLQDGACALFRCNQSRVGKHSQLVVFHDAFLRDDLRDELTFYNGLLP